MRGIRWRAAWVVAGAAVVVLWRVAGGGPGGHVIQIQFGAVPELEGAKVLIDGEPAGTLSKQGSRTVTGFKVSEGEHLVQVGMKGCQGKLTRVSTGFGAGALMLLADVETGWVGGQAECRVVLRR